MKLVTYLQAGTEHVGLLSADGAAVRPLSCPDMNTLIESGDLEGITARLYTGTIAAGQAAGDLRRDMDPAMLAFFFDNLLMMLQFAGCCDYYRERFRLYCGGTPEEQEERLERELLKFLESAFTFEEAEIMHGR